MPSYKRVITAWPGLGLSGRLLAWLELACLLPWWSGTPLFILAFGCAFVAAMASFAMWYKIALRNLILIVSCLLIGGLSVGGRIVHGVEWINLDGLGLALEQVARLIALFSGLKWALMGVKERELLTLFAAIPFKSVQKTSMLLALVLHSLESLTLEDCRKWLSTGQIEWPIAPLIVEGNNVGHSLGWADIMLLLFLPLALVWGASS